MTSHPLTNFEIQKCYQNTSKFHGAYYRNNLPKIKEYLHMRHVINLDKYESIRTHWLVLYVNAENVTYFNSFGVENFKKSKI